MAYLERCRQSLACLQDAVCRSDFDQARTFGHRLKGTGGGYGFPPLTEIGDAIERAALQKKQSDLEVQSKKMTEYLSCVEVTPAVE